MTTVDLLALAFFLLFGGTAGYAVLAYIRNIVRETKDLKAFDRVIMPDTRRKNDRIAH